MNRTSQPKHGVCRPCQFWKKLNAIRGNCSSSRPEGTTSASAHDAQSRPVRITHPNAASPAVGEPATPVGSTYTEIEYAAAGRLAATIDELGRRTEFHYDALGRLTQVTQPHPDDSSLIIHTSYLYDESGNRIAQTDALGHAELSTPTPSIRRLQPPPGVGELAVRPWNPRWFGRWPCARVMPGHSCAASPPGPEIEMDQHAP